MFGCHGKLNDVKVCDDWSKVQKCKKSRGVGPVLRYYALVLVIVWWGCGVIREAESLICNIE